MKGVGRIYQQTFVDTYARVAICKLYTEKTAITTADLLNDRVIPFFAEHKIDLLRILTDRGTEYCGKVENHAYQLYLAVEDVDHSRTKAHRQTASASGSIAQSRMSSTTSRFAKRSTAHWRSCRPIWTCGCISTMNSDHILEDIATAKHLCKPSEKRYTSLSRRQSKRMTNRTMRNTYSVTQVECPSDQVGSFTHKLL